MTALPFEETAILDNPEWRATVERWLDERLRDAGIRRRGPLEQPHLEPWATALSVPTDRGLVWLKVPNSDNREARLYELLGRVAPDQVLKPISLDLELGWILLPDGGPSLGARANGLELIEGMVLALPEYAGLQRAMAGHTSEMLEIGLEDMSPEGLPERFDQVVADRADPQSKAVLQRVRQGFADWCRVLVDSPIPMSIDHNDLHPWNVLGPFPGNERRMAIYDWGDSLVAHPFDSSVEPLSRVRHRTGLAENHPHVLRMRDAYLERFDDLAGRDELIAIADAAWKVSRAARDVVWGARPETIRAYAARVAHGDLGI